MPYRRRKRWVRFTKRVKAASESLASRLITLNWGFDQLLPVWEGNDINFPLQNIACFALFARGQVSTNATMVGNNDLRWIYENEIVDREGDLTANQGGFFGSKNMNKSFRVLSGVLDLTVTNSNVLEETTQQGIRARQHMEYDVYECMLGELGERHNNPVIAEEDAALRNATYGAAYADLSRRGVTLFESQSLTKGMNLKILKKTKFILGPGESFTYQMRDPRNWNITMDQMLNSGFNIRGKTKYLWVIGKPIQAGGPRAEGTLQFGTLYGCTRKYRVTVPDQEISGSGYLRKQ